MTDVIYIPPIEHELAQLMVEYGPKWGFEVPPGVDAMANAGSATTDVRTPTAPSNQHVGDPAIDRAVAAYEAAVKRLLVDLREQNMQAHAGGAGEVKAAEEISTPDGGQLPLMAGLSDPKDDKALMTKGQKITDVSSLDVKVIEMVEDVDEQAGLSGDGRRGTS